MRELHISERQFYEEMSLAMTNRLLLVLEAEHKKLELDARLNKESPTPSSAYRASRVRR